MDVSAEDFRDLFAPPGGIRVALEWEELLRHSPTVTASLTRDRAQLLTGFFPWYVTQGGEETDFADPHGSAIPLANLPQAIASLSSPRRDKIERLRDSLVDAGDEIQLLVPAYRLGDAGRLFLDGCHRLAALSATNLGVRALVLTVEGPIDARILPDLRHWGG